MTDTVEMNGANDAKLARLDAAGEAVRCGHKCTDQSHDMAPFWVRFRFGVRLRVATIIDAGSSPRQSIMDRQNRRLSSWGMVQSNDCVYQPCHGRKLTWETHGRLT